VESGFKSARSRIGPVKHLYQVKGKKNIRAREVELSWGSFNKGDCFILDLGEVCMYKFMRRLKKRFCNISHCGAIIYYFCWLIIYLQLSCVFMLRL